ncbi:MAG: endonuclease/exonuclease/phosphatase family protein [Acidobacteriota bacterium]
MRTVTRHLVSLPLIAVVPWAVGQVLRDRWWLSGLCFYLPSPLLGAALLIAAAFAWRSQRKPLAAASLLAALAPAAVTATLENRWAEPPTAATPANTYTLVHWNVFRGLLGWQSVQDELAERPADIYVISELPESIRSERVAVLGDGFSMIRDYKLGLACRGFVDGRSERPNSDLGLIYAVCQVGDQQLSVLAVDLPASLTTARRPGLETVNRWIQHYQPDLVAGDFNAPRRSGALTDLPSGYSHAYHRVGRGWSYTWPFPLPLWAIDHSLLGPRVQPLSYDLAGSRLSDHRIQTFRFALND